MKRRHFAPAWRLLPLIASAALVAVALLATSAALAQAPTRPLLKKYIGNPDTDALLKEPAVRARLEAMLGKQLPTPTSPSSSVDLLPGGFP